MVQNRSSEQKIGSVRLQFFIRTDFEPIINSLYRFRIKLLKIYYYLIILYCQFVMINYLNEVLSYPFIEE